MKNGYNLSPSRYVVQNGTDDTLPLEDAIVQLQEAGEERKEAGGKLQEVLPRAYGNPIRRHPRLVCLPGNHLLEIDAQVFHYDLYCGSTTTHYAETRVGTGPTHIEFI